MSTSTTQPQLEPGVAMLVLVLKSTSPNQYCPCSKLKEENITLNMKGYTRYAQSVECIMGVEQHAIVHHMTP
ncbi:hypothetical protein LINGRAHAP2_LOCUS19862 [Linum grandiflorum]